MLLKASMMSTMAIASRFGVFLTMIALLIYLAMPNLSFVLPGWHRGSPWQQIVADKVHNDMAKIPKEWVLDPDLVESSKSERVIAGRYFETLLDEDTKRITALDVE